MLINKSRFCSIEVVNGSILYGVDHSIFTAGSGASRIGSSLTVADARAMSASLAAVRSTDSRERSSVEAKPHESSTSTRTPMPSDSELPACPTLPFLVASARWRSSTMRTSAYPAPRWLAVFSAQSAMCFILILSIAAIARDRNVIALIGGRSVCIPTSLPGSRSTDHRITPSPDLGDVPALYPLAPPTPHPRQVRFQKG